MLRSTFSKISDLTNFRNFHRNLYDDEKFWDRKFSKKSNEKKRTSTKYNFFRFRDFLMFFFDDLGSNFDCGSIIFTEKSRKRHWKELEAFCTYGDHSENTSCYPHIQLQKLVHFPGTWSARPLFAEFILFMRSEICVSALKFVSIRTLRLENQL